MSSKESTEQLAAQVAALCRSLGVSPEPETAIRIAGYLDLLTQWNRKTNLVGPRRADEILHTLVADSLPLAGFLESLPLADDPLCLDLGAGAGLPGIPLRCLWTRGRYYLVEVREKRCVFLRLAVGRLGLARTAVLQVRAEEALQQLPDEEIADQSADLILSRAFMPWQELLPFVRPMLAPGGQVVVLANEPLPAVLPEAWRPVESRSYTIRPGREESTRWFWALQAEA